MMATAQLAAAPSSILVPRDFLRRLQRDLRSLMGWANTGEGAVLNAFFRGAATGFPATLYFELYTVAPTDAGGGTPVAGGSYARVAMVANTTNFAAASGGSPSSNSNLVAIAWPGPTANWGTVVSLGILSAASAGTLWRWTNLTIPKTINNGDPAPSLAIGAYSATEN